MSKELTTIANTGSTPKWSTWLKSRAMTRSERIEQRRVLRERLGSLSWLVAVGLIAWIPVDLQTLPSAVALPLLGLRLALALAVIAIATIAKRRPNLPPQLALGAFLVAQAFAFALMEANIPAAAPPLLRIGYGLFPFAIAAQIAVFPLAPRASLPLSTPALVLLLLPAWQGPFAQELSVLGGLWLLTLIVLISAFAGASQLRLLRELLDARNDAAHDGLTQLANRRSGMKRLDAEIANAQRHHRPLALLALDLDRFKAINDQFEHAAGDRVLIEFAATIGESLRQGDLGARIGGEEFIAILPQTDATTAMVVAERIRAQTEALRIEVSEGVEIRCTVSIGLTECRHDDDAATLLARADQALYRAKHEGRNRIVRISAG